MSYSRNDAHSSQEPLPPQSSEHNPEGPTPTSPATEQPTEIAPRPATFLIVDDHHLHRLIMGRQIDKLGFPHDFATNGQEALDIYKASPKNYQCIFMDISMPVMGGFESTSLIRAFERENNLDRCHIVWCIAGNVAYWNHERGREHGVEKVLAKPWNPNMKELKRVLGELGFM